MTYAEARVAHASGSTVSCGRGVRRAGLTWNETLNVTGEREATWYQVDLAEIIAAAPGHNESYELLPNWRYRKVK